MRNYLLLTLGHNSSAVFVGKNKVIGYEQERLDGIKASSRFPQDAINEIIKNVGIREMEGCAIRISHWFDTNVNQVGFKYMTELDFENLGMISDDIVFVNGDFTHHDAHAYSAIDFFNFHITAEKARLKREKAQYVLVADGFGNDQEVLSLYKQDDVYKNKLDLVTRVYGYKRSLGLMYQYATDFCGMKMNQDEYKFLGYEPYIDEYFNNKELYYVHDAIENTVKYLLDEYRHNPGKPITTRGSKKPINLIALRETMDWWSEKFYSILRMVNVHKRDSFRSRVIIAYFIQQVIEKVVCQFVRNHKISNLIVTGGIFYNVKLNNAVLKSIKGLFCAMPLAGDQGAAIGMMVKEGRSFDFKTLRIGDRNIDDIRKKLIPNSHVYDIETTQDFEEVVNKVARLVNGGRIVNIVTGAMEFGPRALCNTTSLFLPTKELVAQNNKSNKRNEVMPCAPVIKEENGPLFFDAVELNRVVGSDYFMICAHDYSVHNKQDTVITEHATKMFMNNYGGVAHKKTGEPGTFTGRPQFVRKGEFVWYVLDFIEHKLNGPKALVNTSFNAHGRPIVFDTMDIIHNFKFQYGNAEEMDSKVATVGEAGKVLPYLVILNFK